MKKCLICNASLDHSETHYGQHLKCFEEIFKVRGKSEFTSFAPKESHSNEPSVTQAHLTSYFAGNYKKYEGKLEGRSYILKFSKEEYPELAPTEYVCNKIAECCGLNLPTPFTLIQFEGQLAFVSKNFMDHMKTHATLNSIYHYLSPDPDHYTVEEINRVLFTQTRSVEDVEQFFRVILYDALVGNHDRHGRNLAFIETAKGKRLAPIYDNPSYLGLESGNMLKMHFSPKGKIWTKDSQEPTMIDYLKEMERLNIFELAKTFFKRVNFRKIITTVEGACCLSREMKNALLKLIQERWQEGDSYVRRQ